jgi:hypothetical protein
MINGAPRSPDDHDALVITTSRGRVRRSRADAAD